MGDVSAKVAAKRLGISYRHLLRKISSGELVAINHNPDGKPMYTVEEDELDRYRRRHRTQSGTAPTDAHGCTNSN